MKDTPLANDAARFTPQPGLHFLRWRSSPRSATHWRSLQPMTVNCRLHPTCSRHEDVCSLDTIRFQGHLRAKRRMADGRAHHQSDYCAVNDFKAELPTTFDHGLLLFTVPHLFVQPVIYAVIGLSQCEAVTPR